MQGHTGTHVHTQVAAESGTLGCAPPGDTHRYPCTDLTHAGEEEWQLPRLSGHTQSQETLWQALTWICSPHSEHWS